MIPKVQTSFSTYHVTLGAGKASQTNVNVPL